MPGICKLLKGIIPGKAAGPDNLNPTDSISPTVLKALGYKLTDTLTLIFQKSLSKWCIPSDCKPANVTLVYMMGKRYGASNYRPISLTCVASKLMKHVICSCVMQYACNNNLLYALLLGLRSARPCETQLIEQWRHHQSTLWRHHQNYTTDSRCLCAKLSKDRKHPREAIR